MIRLRKRKVQSENRKTKVQSLKFFKKKLLVLSFGFVFCMFSRFALAIAEEGDLEFTLDVTAKSVPLPKIFMPDIDLSGRGFHHEYSWPQGIAAPEVLDTWQKDIGFHGIYRLQYNLWEIQESAKDKALHDRLMANYETIIRRITDAGGIVILDIFGMPAGLGKVLDRRSAAIDLRAFKELIKGVIRNLSCDKRYNIWYEVWSTPDLDEFFLGRKQEYFNLYRAVAEGINELEAETKIHIPLGGPSISWWFQNLDGNSIITPERSLIYELIKFCDGNRLPLDFIVWHGYSTDPNIGRDITPYKKTSISLIRDWLSYFNFDRNIPLIMDEWNYDSGANVLPERDEKSYISASYIPSRIKNMYEAGIDYQLYYSLEDFQNNKEGVVRNVGVFWFDAEASEYKGGPKSIYNVFRMLANLGREMLLPTSKINDEFVDIIAAKTQDQEYITILVYNYIDPDIARNYLSRNIASLNNAERKILLSLIKSKGLEKICAKESDISKLRASNKLKTLLRKAQELNAQAEKFKSNARNVRIGIRNLKENYLYQRYTIDSACSRNCEFAPVEGKEVNAIELFQETLVINPYSVNMIVLKKKPPQPQPESVVPGNIEPSAAQNINSTTNNP
jgi:beta-xylosidase